MYPEVFYDSQHHRAGIGHIVPFCVVMLVLLEVLVVVKMPSLH